MPTTEDNPGGVPIDVLDGRWTALAANRAQSFLDLASGPFYGFNRPGATVSQGIIRDFWRQGMMGGVLAQYEEIKAYSETDRLRRRNQDSESRQPGQDRPQLLPQ